MPNKRVPYANAKIGLSVSIPRRLSERLREMAEDEDVPVSTVTQRAIVSGLDDERVSVPPHLREPLKAQALNEGVPVSTIVERALMQELSVRRKVFGVRIGR